MHAITNVLTTADSAMLILVCGGFVGLAFQRFLGIFIKPNYYTQEKLNADR